jgi:hypothetical protein
LADNGKKRPFGFVRFRIARSCLRSKQLPGREKRRRIDSGGVDAEIHGVSWNRGGEQAPQSGGLPVGLSGKSAQDHAAEIQTVGCAIDAPRRMYNVFSMDRVLVVVP